jgi:hypothetical protein
LIGHFPALILAPGLVRPAWKRDIRKERLDLALHAAPGSPIDPVPLQMRSHERNQVIHIAA